MAVFVTVGTTKFDELIRAVVAEDFQKLGKGEYEPDVKVQGMEVDWFRLKPSLQDDMKNSSLIISHGGAGCIFESLGLKKPLVVAINENLMDNHQTELARQLANDGHLVYSTCNKLYDTVQHLRPEELLEYSKGQPGLFGEFMDTVMGFSRTS